MHTFGVVCPSLCMVLLFDYAGVMLWVWTAFLWMSVGHFMLCIYDVYPRLKYNPFFSGLFAFGVGLLWPVWLKWYVPHRGAWGQQ